ncbi:MAG: tetratricopeptide repeat protein [Chitinophagaceae bacterium]
MKKALFAFIIIFLSLLSNAQKKENFSISDSLLKISNSRVPFEQVVTFINAGEHYIFSKGDSALLLLSEAERIAKDNKIDFLLPEIYNLMFQVESKVTGNYPGALFHSLNQLTYALKNIEDGLAYDRQFFAVTSVDWANYNIAFSYAFLGNKQKANEYIDKVDVQFMQMQDHPDYVKKYSLDTGMIISVYGSNAQFYILLNDLAKAKWYNDKAIMINESLPDSTRWCEPYIVKGDILSIQNDYKNGIENFQKAIPIAIKRGFFKDVIEANYGIANNYYKMNEMDSAMKYANNVIRLSGSYTFSEGVLKANQLLYQIWKQKNNRDSTLFYLENAYALRERYFSNIKKYESKNQALEEALHQSNTSEPGTKQRNVISVTVIVLLVIGLFIYFISIKRKKRSMRK